MIIKNGLDQEDEDEGVEEESDSDSGLGASVPPCSVIFIGANVSTGKSSIKLRPRDKKVCTVHICMHNNMLNSWGHILT